MVAASNSWAILGFKCIEFILLEWEETDPLGRLLNDLPMCDILLLEGPNLRSSSFPLGRKSRGIKYARSVLSQTRFQNLSAALERSLMVRYL